MADPLHIEPEFADLLPALSPGEAAGLKGDIAQHGCLAPIIVSVGTPGLEDWTILDGHNRFRICAELVVALPTIKQLAFGSRGAAFNWVIDHQLAKRNITPQTVAFLRGKRYQVEKKAHGGDRTPSDQNDHLPPKPTSETVAEATGVSAPTIRRDAKFAEGVDRLANAGGAEVKAAVLAGKSGLTKGAVQKLADAPVEAVAETAKALKTGVDLPLNNPALYTSNTQEWNTPQHILALAVDVMGAIDLDPCSNSLDSPNVPAAHHYTEAEDGLAQPWAGRVPQPAVWLGTAQVG